MLSKTNRVEAANLDHNSLFSTHTVIPFFYDEGDLRRVVDGFQPCLSRQSAYIVTRETALL